MQPVVPKLWRSGGGPGIDGSQNATDVLVNQCSAFFSETDRVREPTSGSAVGNGEWEGTSWVFVRRVAGNSSAKSSLSPSTLPSPCPFHTQYTLMTEQFQRGIAESDKEPLFRL